MILWRITNHTTLDGRGGLRASGRWHTRGRRVAYCAPNPATALLEVLTHAEIDAEDIPVTFRYLEIEAPDSVSVESADEASLSPGWQRDLEQTRSIGDHWLRSGRTALLRVPSVILPVTWNVLLNPEHPHSAKVRVVRTHQQVLDRRLVR